MPSDEISAMLRVNRARAWSEFRAALDSIAVPGQNLTYADVDGHIGKAIAARLPRRPLAPPAEPILPRSAAIHWESFVTASDLPVIFDPADGFVTSANERPSGTPVPIGYVFSSNKRSERLIVLLGGRPRHSLGDLIDMQRDISAPWALQLRSDLVRCLRSVTGSENAPVPELIRTLEDWDGRYAMDSRGALAFELLVFFLIRALSGRKRLALYAASWNAWHFIRADIATAAPDLLAKAARRAACAAAKRLKKYRVWGDMHRLRLPHIASVFPVIGLRFRFGDWPASGGGETVLKTEHPLTDRRHYVRVAASARHISDLSDPDRNYFVLLGGQDGWLGSTTMLDQVPLWQAERYIRVPLTIDAVRRSFRIHTELTP
jgi:penicillin amidase